MGSLVLLLLSGIVFVSALALSGHRSDSSRSELLAATFLVFNGLLVAPIFLLGFLQILTARTLAMLSIAVSGSILAYVIRTDGWPMFRDRMKRDSIGLLRLPYDAARELVSRRSPILIGFSYGVAFLLWVSLSVPLAPGKGFWDALWYQEPIVGFAIQNHGFSLVELPKTLETVNGSPRICEMTALWFAMFGGRAFREAPNVVFAPLLLLGAYGLVHRFSRDRVLSVGWAFALLLMPANLRLLQCSMVDPHTATLIVAAAYWVTRPELTVRSTMLAALGIALASGTKYISLAPAGLLSVLLLLRVLSRSRDLGSRRVAVMLIAGGALVLAGVATTLLRNYVNKGNPIWPFGVDLQSVGIHWPSAVAGKKTVFKSGASAFPHDSADEMWRAVRALPDPIKAHRGGAFRVLDYGMGVAWVAIPLAGLAMVASVATWLGYSIRRRLGMLVDPRRAALAASMAGLTLVTLMAVKVYPTPLYGRYYVGLVGMAIAAMGWMASYPRFRTLSYVAVVAVHVLSIAQATISNDKMKIWRPPSELVALWKLSPAEREYSDAQVATKMTEKVGRARTRDLHRGDVVVFDHMNFVGFLWNDDYTNRVAWAHNKALLKKAKKVGAKWIYARKPANQAALSRDGAWDYVGPLEDRAKYRAGKVYRRSRATIALRGASGSKPAVTAHGGSS